MDPLGGTTSARKRVTNDVSLPLPVQLSGRVYVNGAVALERSAKVGAGSVENNTVLDPWSGNSGLPGSAAPLESNPYRRATTPLTGTLPRALVTYTRTIVRCRCPSPTPV